MGLVSFIIPHFNSSDFLVQTVSSLFQQTYRDIEVVVVDDGSTDLELKALFKLEETWPEIRIFHRPNYLVKGANSCRNYGLEKSKGEFVNFVDADDILIADKIEKQIKLFSGNSSFGMVVCKTRYFRNSLSNQVELLQKLEFGGDTDFLEYYLSKKGVWCTNSALIRKEAIGETRFKEGQIDAHEWLFFLSLMLNDVKVSAVNEVLVMKRIHQNTVGNINIRYKTPSLLEARKIIYSKILNYRSPKRNYYLKLLLEDVNALLKTTGKCGQFRLYFSTLMFFELNFVKLVRGFILFFVFWILKKGTSFSVISLYE